MGIFAIFKTSKIRYLDERIVFYILALISGIKQFTMMKQGNIKFDIKSDIKSEYSQEVTEKVDK